MKYKRRILALLITILVFFISGCGDSFVKKPSDAYVTKALRNIPAVTGVESVTEGHDPNDLLNRTGGYIGCVYFTVNDIDLSAYGISSNVSIVDLGTGGGGCVEIFKTSKEAESRNEYLSGFDNTIFKSGSHEVVGTVIIRTSSELSGNRQQELTKQIKNELIKGKIIPVAIVGGVLVIAVVISVSVVISKKTKKPSASGTPQSESDGVDEAKKKASSGKGLKIIIAVLSLIIVGGAAIFGIITVSRQTAQKNAKKAVETYLNGMVNGDEAAVRSVCSANVSDNGQYTMILYKDTILFDSFIQGMGDQVELDQLSDEVNASYNQLCTTIAQNSVRHYTIDRVSGSEGVFTINVTAYRYGENAISGAGQDLYSIANQYAQDNYNSLMSLYYSQGEEALALAIYNGILPDVFNTIASSVASSEDYQYSITFTVEKIDGTYVITSINVVE